MNNGNFSRDDMILGGVAILLVIDLLFLPWFSISLGPLGSADFSATGAPDGWLGILGMLAAIAVVVDLGIQRLSPQTTVPAVGGSREATRFFLSAAAAVFVALKFLFHIHFSIFGFGFYLAVILAVALLYVAMQARNAQPILPTRPVGPAGPPAV